MIVLPSLITSAWQRAQEFHQWSHFRLQNPKSQLTCQCYVFRLTLLRRNSTLTVPTRTAYQLKISATQLTIRLLLIIRTMMFQQSATAHRVSEAQHLTPSSSNGRRLKFSVLNESSDQKLKNQVRSWFRHAKENVSDRSTSKVSVTITITEMNSVQKSRRNTRRFHESPSKTPQMITTSSSRRRQSKSQDQFRRQVLSVSHRCPVSKRLTSHLSDWKFRVCSNETIPVGAKLVTTMKGEIQGTKWKTNKTREEKSQENLSISWLRAPPSDVKTHQLFKVIIAQNCHLGRCFKKNAFLPMLFAQFQTLIKLS